MTILMHQMTQMTDKLRRKEDNKYVIYWESLLSFQYSFELDIVPSEKELFYGCPPSMASEIPQNVFVLDTNCIHGKSFGDLITKFL